MMEAIALKIAKKMKAIEPERTPSIEVMKFSLEGILNISVTIVISLLIGALTGHLGEVALGLLAFALLRFFSGGFHLHKSIYCSVLTVAIICAAPLLTLEREWFIAVTVGTLILLFVFAPSNIAGHARLPQKYFPLLKLISLIIVGSNFLFDSSTLAIVFFAQSLTTISFRKEVK